MQCPQCGAWVMVKDTRKRQGNVTRRRYECANLHRFNTEERVVESKERTASDAPSPTRR